ncbi:sugar transferase [Maribacter litoralis]|uniref:sugar transferase n=1 Tax=Maribacter litoralis TaxID=2059726 RepID=UPI003F5CC10C
MVYPFIKRFFDFSISILIFIIALPIFILITITLYFNNNGQPFFYQQRPGKDEKIFSIIKFKTMTDKKDENQNLLPDWQRTTKFGKTLRKLSLDEIPQLLNVIKGDMSLVGPRPLLVSYLTRYNLEQKKRHLVKPGITGWAQVNGRNAIGWSKKFELDIWYVSNMSFIIDLKILWLTVKKVIKTEGVSASSKENMKEFMGNK